MRAWWWLFVTSQLVCGNPENTEDVYDHNNTEERLTDEELEPNSTYNPDVDFKRRKRDPADEEREKREPKFHSWGGKRYEDDEDEENDEVHLEDISPYNNIPHQRDFVEVLTLNPAKRIKQTPAFSSWGGKRDPEMVGNLDKKMKIYEPTLKGAFRPLSSELNIKRYPAFNSWAGKRTTAFNSWGGKRAAPFNSWGGKRAAAFNSWGGKRAAAFNSWGGKRAAAFNSWGGKRAAAFNSWGGKRAAAFNSWGGKRAAAFNSWGGKRAAAFNSWGGKRAAAFNSWGGKRADHLNKGDQEDAAFDNWSGKRAAAFNSWGGKRKDLEINDGDYMEENDTVPLNQELDLKNEEYHSGDNLFHVNEKDYINNLTAENEETENWEEERGPNTNLSPSTFKRAAAFNSWGGKRVPSFNSWGGKKATAFNSWAGKRVPAFNSWGGKRSPLPLHSWGDKRTTAFNSWGGKRSDNELPGNNIYFKSPNLKLYSRAHFPKQVSLISELITPEEVNNLININEVIKHRGEFVGKLLSGKTNQVSEEDSYDDESFLNSNPNSFLNKREAFHKVQPRYKGFSSWAGKRYAQNNFMEKKTSPTFSSWAGKRSPIFTWHGNKIPTVLLANGKRRPAFSSWGGKRSENNAISPKDFLTQDCTSCKTEQNGKIAEVESQYIEDAQTQTSEDGSSSRNKREVHCDDKESNMFNPNCKEKKADNSVKKNTVVTRMLLQGGIAWPMMMKSLPRGMEFYAWGGKRSL